MVKKMATKRSTTADTEAQEVEAGVVSQKIKCGLIMPISKSQGLEPEHWLNVKGIICEALADTEFDVRLVSESDDVGVIHKSIVQNIYKNDIVICDVSTHNANVMFELGLRLAFDKPTVIIKDDETPFSFDTQVIEHIVYKRSLHYVDIVSFKRKLKDKVLATLEQSRQPDFSTFLGHFTINHVSRIEERTVSINDMFIERLDQMQKSINAISRQQAQQSDNIVFSSVSSHFRRPVAGVEWTLKNSVRQFLSTLANSTNMDSKAFANYLSNMTVAEADSLVSQFNAYWRDMNPNMIPFAPHLIKNEVEGFINEAEQK